MVYKGKAYSQKHRFKLCTARYFALDRDSALPEGKIDAMQAKVGTINERQGPKFREEIVAEKQGKAV